MKKFTTLSILTAFGAIALSGCSQLNQGTSPGFESGAGYGAGVSPDLPGRIGPFQQTGFPDANIAASREQAALDVSGSGAAELSRRSEAAAAPVPAPTDIRTDREAPRMTADDILIDRVQQALSATNLANTPTGPALSIQSLHNLHLGARNGIVTLRGRVGSQEDKNQIQALVRGVTGVKGVQNRLEIAQPSSPAARPEPESAREAR